MGLARPALRLPKTRLRIVPPRLPRLDADDAGALWRLVIYSVLAVWVAGIIAFALGLAVRVFILAAYG